MSNTTYTVSYTHVGLFRVCKNNSTKHVWLEYDSGDGEWLEVEENDMGEVLMANADDAKAVVIVMLQMMRH